jgi:hypothetical protein
MMSRNQPRPSKEEAQRNKIIKANGCMLTWLKFGKKKYAEIHHITMPGKRLGHAYTIPLSPWYHRGTCDPGKTKDEMRAKYGASLADGTRVFVASHHYTELELWQKLQVAMGLDDSLPATKVLPRRIGGNRANTNMVALCGPRSTDATGLRERALPGNVSCGHDTLGAHDPGLGGSLASEAPDSAVGVLSGGRR